MCKGFRRRLGVSIIELTLVVGILVLVAALMLGAIARVRDAAFQTESKNNLRQIGLATHGYASVNGQSFPSMTRPPSANPKKKALSVFVAVRPFLTENRAGSNRGKTRTYPIVETYLSPSDPTAQQGVDRKRALCSYAANAMVFNGNTSLPSLFSDGESNTIAFAEHYSYDCGGVSFYYWYNLPNNIGQHRPTFADIGDVRPTTTLNQSLLRSVPYQAGPPVFACQPLVAQTPHATGMLVGLADAGVRSIAPQISLATFWAALTPNGGDALGDDW